MDSALFVLLVISALILMPSILVVIFGILCTPFVAATCAMLARRRGLDCRYYGLAGALYSMFSFSPECF